MKQLKPFEVIYLLTLKKMKEVLLYYFCFSMDIALAALPGY